MKNKESIVLDAYYAMLTCKTPTTLEVHRQLNYDIEVNAYDMIFYDEQLDKISVDNIHELLLAYRCEHSHNGVIFNSHQNFLSEGLLNENKKRHIPKDDFSERDG